MGWFEELASEADVALWRLFPSGEPGLGYHSLLQLVPRVGSRLEQYLGEAWIGACQVQIWVTK